MGESRVECVERRYARKLPPPLDRGAQAEREHCTECHRWVVTGLCSAMLAGALKETRLTIYPRNGGPGFQRKNRTPSQKRSVTQFSNSTGASDHTRTMLSFTSDSIPVRDQAKRLH